jgi:hypothetical protein
MTARFRLICLVCFLGTIGSATTVNPVPFVNQPLLPGRATPGSKNLRLTVTGTGFTSGSDVKWNGESLATTMVSAQKLIAQVPAADLVSAGTAAVTVVNPTPGGGISNVVLFEITDATPIALPFESRIFTPAVIFSTVTGDFNSDGHAHVVASMGNAIAVFLGNGDGTFGVSSFSTPATFVGALATGDFNGDGKLDLAFPDPSNNLIYILLGNGDGTFQQGPTLAIPNDPVALAVGDFNNDGKLDLAVVQAGANEISILLGNGDGTFQIQSTVATGLQPNAAVVADFNGDGRLDLAVVNSGSNTLSILLGSGDGHFQLQSSPKTGISPNSLVAADFNGDGKTDLAVTNVCGETLNCNVTVDKGSISSFLGNGDGTFSLTAEIPAGGSSPYGIVAGDFNGDGRLDLAVAFHEDVARIFFGGSKGMFHTPTQASSGVFPVSVVAADFNGDGRLDLAISNSGAVDGSSYLSVDLQSPVSFNRTLLRSHPNRLAPPARRKPSSSRMWGQPRSA